MNTDQSYRKAFSIALGLHLAMLIMLVIDSSNSQSVLTKENQNTPGMQQPMIASVHQSEIVKAVSIDNKAVIETVKQLKFEREQQRIAEVRRQQELNKQAELAKQQRIREQQQIARLKEEANKVAIAHKKQAEEEQKHLKELAEKQAFETKHIQELKKQKEELLKQKEIEAKQLAALNQKRLEEKAKADKLREEKELAAKQRAEKIHAEQVAKSELERKQAQAIAQQRAEAQARMAGEVDKYKALIVNAISRHWILPENVDGGLSSQFRIRLAPDGAVLEVSLTRSSGDPLLDRSAQTAIYKASPLPVPTDAEAFNIFRDISLTVRPEQV